MSATARGDTTLTVIPAVDAAAAPRLAPETDGGPAVEEGAVETRGEDLPPLGVGHLRHRPVTGHAGVVDHGVDRAEGRAHLEHLLGGARDTDVAGRDDRPPALGFDLPLHGREPARVAPVERDRPAAPRKAERVPAAEPAAGSRHEDDATVEPETGGHQRTVRCIRAAAGVGSALRRSMEVTGAPRRSVGPREAEHVLADVVEHHLL